MSQPLAVPARLDHLMVVVPDLEKGVREFAELTGTTVKGGRHAEAGTANYLVGLRPLPGVDDTPPYLEILGPDPEADPTASEDRRRDIIGDAQGPVLRQAEHPAASLEPQLSVVGLEIHAADRACSEEMLQAFGLNVSVRETGSDSLAATLSTPAGTVTISSAGVR